MVHDGQPRPSIRLGQGLYGLAKDNKGCKGCFRLLENAIDELSIQVKPTLSTGAPLPSPPIYRDLSTIWTGRPKAGLIHALPTQKIPRIPTPVPCYSLLPLDGPTPFLWPGGQARLAKAC